MKTGKKLILNSFLYLFSILFFLFGLILINEYLTDIKVRELAVYLVQFIVIVLNLFGLYLSFTILFSKEKLGIHVIFFGVLLALSQIMMVGSFVMVIIAKVFMGWSV